MKDIRRHSWNTTFFFIQISSSSGCLCFYILFYCITLQVLIESALKMNSFLSKIKFQELKLGQCCQSCCQSVSQNLVSGGDKVNGSDEMVQKMHSFALVPPSLLVQSRHWSLWSAVHVTQLSFHGEDQGVYLWEKTDRQGYYFSLASKTRSYFSCPRKD